MPKIIDTTDPNYIAYCKNFHQNGNGAYNGAYYYSKEIVDNIIPNVSTNRPWDTLGMKFLKSNNHAIIFIHHNINQDKVYKWLDRYYDLVYVCSTEDTFKWAKTKKNGHAVFLPLSIDVEYVKQFRTDKTKKACYSGNKWQFKIPDIKKYVPETVDFPPSNIPREELLKFIAPYKECYAIGRCAIEALVLGCKIKVCSSRYKDPSYWKILDNKQAAKMLQKELDKIDKS